MFPAHTSYGALSSRFLAVPLWIWYYGVRLPEWIWATARPLRDRGMWPTLRLHGNWGFGVSASNGTPTTGGGAAAPSPDGPSDVSVALTLGWHLAELYRPTRRRSYTAPGNDLPGLGRLSDLEYQRLQLDQLRVGVAKLKPVVDAVNLTLPDIDAFGSTLPTPGQDDEARKRAIRDAHVKLLTALEAADFRLGKAYGLGRALADTCIGSTDLETLGEQLKDYRCEQLRAWLEDLESALPTYSGHAVSKSLADWSTWAEKKATGDEVGRMLPRLHEQGRLWLSLLSGERSAPAVLDADSYVNAASLALKRTAGLVRGFLLRNWQLTVAALLLFAGGITLMLVDKTATASIVAGASGVVASIGLSWKAISTAFGQAVEKAEQPLWSDALADEIALAITLAPKQSGVLNRSWTTSNLNFRKQEMPAPKRGQAAD